MTNSCLQTDGNYTILFNMTDGNFITRDVSPLMIVVVNGPRRKRKDDDRVASGKRDGNGWKTAYPAAKFNVVSRGNYLLFITK